MNQHTRPILNRNKPLLIVVPLVLILALLIAHILTQPQRSVANFCKVRQQQDAWLADNAKGDTYDSAVFPDRSSSNAADFAKALGPLEQVAPNDVEGNIHTLRLAYQKIHDDPSQAIGAAFGATQADSDAAAWIKQHCTQ